MINPLATTTPTVVVDPPMDTVAPDEPLAARFAVLEKMVWDLSGMVSEVAHLSAMLKSLSLTVSEHAKRLDIIEAQIAMSYDQQ